MLTKTQLLECAKSRKTATVSIPDLGDVTVRELKKSETDSCKGLSEEAAAERIIIMGVEGENGQPMFSDADLPTIRELPAGVFKTLVDAIIEVSGLKKK